MPKRKPVSIGDVTFGAGALPVIAGPCSVETDYVRHAVAAAEAGADVLRGCVFKPRSRPDRFQGIGTAGIPLLAEAGKATGLPLIAEPMDGDDVRELRPYVHAFLIGTRSMYNSRLLQEVGRSGLPCVLKRGFSATYEEWVGAAEYVRSTGNENVILCERGIRTFVTETRNTLDLSALAAVRDLTDQPVIIDPSHAAGKREWVTELALGAAAMGADGLIVESHPDPERSWTDDRQALDTPSLRSLIRRTRLVGAVARSEYLDERTPASPEHLFETWNKPLAAGRLG